MKTGVNVFLTGEPGAGKTHTVNTYVAYLRARGIEPAITASTGIAATHIGGRTIHSWSGIGIKTSLEKRDLDRLASTYYEANHIKKAKVLIIDEVSMLAPGTLSLVDTVCRRVRGDGRPFGGMQVVLVGDFFQLPPVVRRDAVDLQQSTLLEEPKNRFAYDSLAWTNSNPTVCYLTDQYRQDDDVFLSVLSAIRRNVFDEDHLQHIESRKVANRGLPPGAPKLYSHNIDVDRVNNEMLEKLSGESRAFDMSAQGQAALVTTLKKGCLSPEILQLKKGASVMFTKNNQKEGYVNGTLGTVENFSADGKPMVRTRNGRLVVVEPLEWVVEEHGKVRARISQLPLRLAWAITVHKSQGMSLDEAVMDLSQVFEYGQGYVALSRVRRLSGLHLLGYNARAFQVHPDVLLMDAIFRKASDQAEIDSDILSPDDLAKKQDDFIITSEGKLTARRSTLSHETPETKKTDGYGEIRQKHPNAYRSWSQLEDQDLKEAYERGVATAVLAEKFGRKKGAIKSRLVKLGLVEV